MLERPNTGLVQALRFASGVVFSVLGQISELARHLDLGDDLGAPHLAKVLKLGLGLRPAFRADRVLFTSHASTVAVTPS